MKLLTLGFLLSLVLMGCGDDDDGADVLASGGDTPEKALERQFRYLVDGQAKEAYESVHPLQRTFVTAEKYRECTKEAGAFDLGEFKVKSVTDESMVVPGTDKTEQVKSITAELELKNGAASRRDTDTYHMFLVDGKWYGIVGDAEAYKRGECP